jgi:hypothetical protein
MKIAMRTIAVLFVLSSALSLAQYQSKPGAALPSSLNSNLAAALDPAGFAVTNSKGPWMDVWFVKELPKGEKTVESDVTLSTVPHGSYLGVIQVHQRTADRRGNPLKPGLYVMRLSYFPVNGAHQGIAPQRDFVVLTDAATDTDSKATPAYEPLMKDSEKAAGIPHPLVLSTWKAEGEDKTGLVRSEVHESDWIYYAKIGTTPIALILAGQAEQ